MPRSCLRRVRFIFAATILFAGLPVFGQVAPKRITTDDDITLHYIEFGEGEPIIFVHGATSDLYFWTQQLRSFASEGYRAIAYSRRYNFPNKNKPSPNHSAVVEASDLAQLIRKMKLGKVHVVGFSYGAYTALILSLDHPELLRTVTLAEPPVAQWLKDLQGDQSAEAKAFYARLMNNCVKSVNAAFQANKEELALKTFLEFVGGEKAFVRLPPPVKASMMRNIGELRAIMGSDDPYPMVDREEVRNTKVPTLILSGSETVSTAKYSDLELERLVPEQLQKRVILPGASHIMWVEQPVQSREAVLSFIAERKSTAR